jgi:RNA polymerase sigma factor (sigma-70 family)
MISDTVGIFSIHGEEDVNCAIGQGDAVIGAEGVPSGKMGASHPHRTIEAVWRIESARIIAALARLLRDVGRAEELAQDALVAALEQWPRSGIPDNPGAWLMATAKHRAIDQLRHRSVAERKHQQLGYEMDTVEAPAGPDFEALDDDIGDDLLRLIFTACHPVLSSEARVALTLRLIGGLTTEEIARAFLVSEATMAQRIVRAKRTLSEARVPFEIPSGAQLAERLGSVLQVIYLVFNEGYAATAGEDWARPALCEDALRLGRILAELAPNEAEIHGLVALMEIQASRLRARVDAAGAPVSLLNQERARWDRLLIHRGLAALERAARLNGARPPHFARFAIAPGPYVLQAEIAACHARALTAEATDWQRIAALYAALMILMPSPVVSLNRAVAVGMADGPAAGLAIIDTLSDDPSLGDYHLLPTVRGDLLEKLGRYAEARAEFIRAAKLTNNARERQFLQERVERMTAELGG